MPHYRVILVGAKSQGNVGSVARAMKNFGFTDLVLVEPPAIGEEAKGRAMHAWDIVESARTVDSFDEAIEGLDFVVGTSARIPEDEKNHLRNPVDVRDLPRRLSDMAGTVGLLFGREDFGLFNEELEHCDLLATIPTTTSYRSLNLSHAVAVVLYELHVQARAGAVKALTPMSGEMKRHFEGAMDQLIDLLALPKHKSVTTKRVYRKVLGRGVPSAWEYFVLMGVLSGTLRRLGVEIRSGKFEPRLDVTGGLDEEFRALLESRD